MSQELREEESLKGLELQRRIQKLTLRSLRAALLSIENVGRLEAAILAGEKYQELVSKLKRNRP